MLGLSRCRFRMVIAGHGKATVAEVLQTPLDAEYRLNITVDLSRRHSDGVWASGKEVQDTDISELSTNT